MRTFALMFLGLSLQSQAFAVSSFALVDMNRTPTAMYKSAEHHCAVFAIENYFVGCPTCNKNAANVSELAAAYAKESNLQILDVGIDTDQDDYDLWIERHTPQHPVLNDSKRVLSKQLGTTEYPSFYILDYNLKVIYKTEDIWSEQTKGEIHKTIDAALAQAAQACP